jgi:hypothetical protein
MQLKEKVLLILIPFLGRILIWLVGRSIRLKVLGKHAIDELHDRGERVIYTFWHNRIFFMAYYYRGQNIHVLVSQGLDGEYIARTIHGLGNQTIRGSTTRGGSMALVEMVKRLRAGFDGAFTPDGPQGPRYKVQPGVIRLAQKTGLAIAPVTFNSSRRKTLQSWDGFIIPYPWSRGIFIYGPPIKVPSNATDSVIEDSVHELEEGLNRITSQADGYFSEM